MFGTTTSSLRSLATLALAALSLASCDNPRGDRADQQALAGVKVDADAVAVFDGVGHKTKEEDLRMGCEDSGRVGRAVICVS